MRLSNLLTYRLVKRKRKREKGHGFGSLLTQSLYFGKKKKCVSDEQSIYVVYMYGHSHGIFSPIGSSLDCTSKMC